MSVRFRQMENLTEEQESAFRRHELDFNALLSRSVVKDIAAAEKAYLILKYTSLLGDIFGEFQLFVGGDVLDAASTLIDHPRMDPRVKVINVCGWTGNILIRETGSGFTGTLVIDGMLFSASGDSEAAVIGRLYAAQTAFVALIGGCRKRPAPEADLVPPPGCG